MARKNRPSGATRARRAKQAARDAPEVHRPLLAPRFRPSPKVRPKAKARAERDAPRARPEATRRPRAPPTPVSSPEAEGSLGSEPQDRPLRLFPAVEEDHCEFCLQAFCDELPFVPAGRAIGNEVSAARADLRLCSGCTPIVQLVERLQRSSLEVRRFLRVATAALNTHLSVAAHRPLSADRVVIRYDRPVDQARRSNLYESQGSRQR